MEAPPALCYRSSFWATATFSATTTTTTIPDDADDAANSAKWAVMPDMVIRLTNEGLEQASWVRVCGPRAHSGEHQHGKKPERLRSDFPVRITDSDWGRRIK